MLAVTRSGTGRRSRPPPSPRGAARRFRNRTSPEPAPRRRAPPTRWTSRRRRQPCPAPCRRSDRRAPPRVAPRRWRNRFRRNVTGGGLACATLADIPSIAPTSAIATSALPSLRMSFGSLLGSWQSGPTMRTTCPATTEAKALSGGVTTQVDPWQAQATEVATAPTVRCPSLTGDPLGGVSTAPQPSRPLRTTQRASFAPVSRRIVHSTGATGAQPASCLPKADISHSRMCRTRWIGIGEREQCCARDSNQTPCPYRLGRGSLSSTSASGGRAIRCFSIEGRIDRLPRLASTTGVGEGRLALCRLVEVT